TVPLRLPPGWTSTTLDADTPHLAASRQPADCHQPCDRVHLGGALHLRIRWWEGMEGPAAGNPGRGSCRVPPRLPVGHSFINSRIRGMTWRPYSSMLVMRISWAKPPAPYFRSKRVAPSVRMLVAIFWATVSGDPT